VLKKKMLLIFNPHSGLAKFPDNLFKITDKFTSAGYLVTTYPTQEAGEAAKMIEYYAGDYDYLVCAGGDGTVNEAISALLKLEKRPVFGIIPCGTSNDFASSLGLPKDILGAGEAIVDGLPKSIDIGCFDGLNFCYVAAFGLFTDVSYATPQNVKNILGHLAYVLEGLKRLGSIRSYRCELELDGEKIAGDFVFGMVANSQSVGGMKLPEKIGAKMDDSLFEVLLLQMPETFADLQHTISAVIKQEEYTDSIIIRKAKKVIFKSTEIIPWTLDGEFGGNYSNVEINNLHHALSIIS